MYPLYTVADIRQIENAALANMPAYTLMQRAGEACAQTVLSLIVNQHEARILVLAGPGNNGGDALEAAYHLSQYGMHIVVVLCAQVQTSDAQRALERARSACIQFLSATTVESLPAEAWTLVIDGLFGIGLTRPISGAMRAYIDYINTLHCPVVAIDIASGLDADTGQIIGGADGVAVRASHTVTFIGAKMGLYTCDGPDYSGVVSIDKLGLDESSWAPAPAYTNDPSLFISALKPRTRHNTHKGSYGSVIVVGGADGMAGAPILAAKMASYAGAGRVFVALMANAPAYDMEHPELMMRDARTIALDHASCIVVGPGLGTGRDAHDVLARVLASQLPLVIDADALNLIAMEPGLQGKLRQRDALSHIITPHPLEAARLLGTQVAEIQSNRPLSATQLAQQYNSIVVLKGAGTIVAVPDHRSIVINTTGNPALSTAGTGDVGAGLCGALIAQGCPARQAALAAVWLHGKAADQLVDSGLGPIGLTVHELIVAIRTLLNQVIKEHTD